MPPYNYNVYPSPISGQGPYGRVPGTISLPQPARDLGAQYPNLGQTNAALSRSILAGLEGQLSPGTINALQDQNAAWAIGAGMPATTPGSLGLHRFARDIGRTAEDLQAAAAQRYASIIPTISSTQTVRPETQISVAEQNALNLASPDPAAAQSYAQQLYQRYLQGMSGGGGYRGPQGGTRGGSDYMAGPAGGEGTIVAPSLGTATMVGGVPTYPGQGPSQPWWMGSAGFQQPGYEGSGYDFGMSDADYANWVQSGAMPGEGTTGYAGGYGGGGYDFGMSDTDWENFMTTGQLPGEGDYSGGFEDVFGP